jgi:hypothetical protein
MQMPTFAQNFQVGDVIYGLSRSREPYVATLTKAMQDNCKNQGAYVSCDHFNNRTWLQNALSHADTSSAQKIQDNLDWNLGKLPHSGIPLNANQKQELQAFYDNLLLSTRSPANTGALNMPQKQLNKKKNRYLQDLQIRRACKFGIEYIIGRNNTVHFVLDIPVRDIHGNDQDQLSGTYMKDKDIVKKKTLHPNYVPITTSELRLCYRNWGTWGPTGHLKFYKSLQEVNAPWVDNAAGWAEYDRHRQLKQLKNDYPNTWWIRKLGT